MNLKQILLVIILFSTGLVFMSLPLWIDQILPLLADLVRYVQETVNKLEAAIKALITILHQS